MKKINANDIEWVLLGQVELGELEQPRRMLHQAVQYIAMVGKSFLPERSDDSQTSMVWDHDLNLFRGENIGGNSPLWMALRPADLSLVLLSLEISETFSLIGKTFAEGMEWLRQKLPMRIGNGELSDSLNYQIPAPLAEKEPFRVESQAALIELSRYFANANSVLQALAMQLPGAGMVRCWPHHFDLATLLQVAGGKIKGATESLGIGLSPGDENYGQPYFYLTPWPYPKPEEVTHLPLEGGGFWHTRGWIGAVLPAERFCLFPEPGNQRTAVINFLNSALEALFRISG
ncbi:MAG: hypothetical protein Kow0042_23620 [Calditrichia bacterium]